MLNNIRYHGKGERFVLESGRDPAMVNWRQDANTGMIRSNIDGRWMQPERPKLEDHPEDMHHHLTLLGLASSDI